MNHCGNEKKKVTIVTNNVSCEQHFQSIAKLEEYFLANGWDISSGFEGVDKVVISGCGFHDFMFKKVLNTLEHLKTLCFEPKNVIIHGCISKTHSQNLREHFQGDLIETKNSEVLDKVINAKVPLSEIAIKNVFNFPGQQDNKTFYIKIMQGCLMECTYCIIKYAMGYIQSVSQEEILNQYEIARNNGFRKIHFMGEDTFAYGLDINSNLIKVINELIKIDDSLELDIGNFHLKWLEDYGDDILELCKKNIVKKLYISIQHINPFILKHMGRETDFYALYEVIRKIRAAAPQVRIFTDIIVGFPGETQEIFEELLEFLKADTCFTKVTHYGYSDNANTPSYNFPDKVSSFQVTKRWNALKEILGQRSPYTDNNNCDSFDEMTQQTMDNDFVICKNTYKPLT